MILINLLNCDTKEGKLLFYTLNLIFMLYISYRVTGSALEGLIGFQSDVQFKITMVEIAIFFIANFIVTIYSKRIVLNFIKNIFIGSGIVIIGLIIFL